MPRISLTDTARSIASGELSPSDAVDNALAAIERTQSRWNALTHVFAEHARARAKELSVMEPVGPLYGVPVVVKELYDVAGAPTTGCCRAYEDRIATSDSAVVERLQHAGAIILAKANQHELALGASTTVSSFGAAVNPWGEGRIPGGSSGGSAIAVAAGVVPFAMGSDTGGSIRIPSSFCGVTGLKTTKGAISLHGAMSMMPSTDTAGPIAVTAEDCSLVYRVLAGFDARDRSSRRAQHAPSDTGRPLRIALPKGFFTLCQPTVRQAVEAAAETFENLGAVLVQIDGPDVDEAWAAFLPLWAEVADTFRDILDDERIDQETRFLFALGRSFDGMAVAEGRRAAMGLIRDFESAFGEADVLLAPATPFTAPPADAPSIDVDGAMLDTRSGPARFTVPANVAGLPSLSFPVGFDTDQMPIGAQLMGPAWSDERLCEIVAGYQGATAHHLAEPAT